MIMINHYIKSTCDKANYIGTEAITLMASLNLFNLIENIKALLSIHQTASTLRVKSRNSSNNIEQEVISNRRHQ